MISILTPTYNRAYILHKLYESLLRQSDLDFEWIIIDDGSTDNTEELVKKWKIENKLFSIYYYRKENGGKHTAINYGMQYINSDYTFIVDSDDYLTNDAIELIHSWITPVANNLKFAGVSGLRGTSERPKDRIGGFPDNEYYIDSSNLDRGKNFLHGDKAEVYKTNILKKYPFPEFKGENFLTESIVWNEIANDGYIIRWYNEIIWICEYLDDGLTKNDGIENAIRNFQGYTLSEYKNFQLFYFPINYLALGRFHEVAKKKGLNNKQIVEEFNTNYTSLIFSKILLKITQIYKNFNFSLLD